MRPKAVLTGIIFSIISLVFLLLPVFLYRTPKQAIRFDPIYRIVDPNQNESELPLGRFLKAFQNPGYIPGTYHFSLTLQHDPRSPIPGPYLYLVFPYIAGTAMSVSWNCQFIGSQGDMARGNSNIWNSAKIFTIPTELLFQTNTLSVEIIGPYEAGFPFEPYILSSKQGAFFTALLHFFSESLILIIVGALLVLGFIVIATGARITMKPNAMLFLGLACLCTTLFLMDFMTLETLLVPLLEFKRAVAILRHLAATFFLFGFMALIDDTKNWFSKAFIGIQILCCLLLFFPRTMIGMKNMYSWTFLTIALLPIYLLIRLIKQKNLIQSNLVLIVGVAFASIISLRDTLLPFFGKSTIFLSHYGFSLMILAAVGFVVIEFLDQNKRLIVEETLASRFREESMHDPLTGLYNRNILNEVLSTLDKRFSILVVDINGLKSINDTFGHLAGDEVLRDASRIMKSLVRNSEIVVRTGGDEFLMILPDLTSIQADEMASELKQRILASRIENFAGRASFSYSVSVGSASFQSEVPVDHQVFTKILDAADHQMYSNKERYRQHNISKEF